MKKRAFTMVELIFVIVILGILAAVAVPKLNASREDASAAAAIANLRILLNDLQSYYNAKSEGFGSGTMKAADSRTGPELFKSVNMAQYDCGGSQTHSFSQGEDYRCEAQVYDIAQMTNVPLISSKQKVGTLSIRTDKKKPEADGSYAKLKEAADTASRTGGAAEENANAALRAYVENDANWTTATEDITVSGGSYILQAKKDENCLEFKITSSSTLKVTALKAADANGTGCAKFLANNTVKGLLKDPKTGTQIAATKDAELDMDFSGKGVKFE